MCSTWCASGKAGTGSTREAEREEMSRILKPRGWWTAWWNRPWADEEPWFDEYYTLLETTCPGVSRNQRNIDWCSEAIAVQGTFSLPERRIVEWGRRVAVEDPSWSFERAPLTDSEAASQVVFQAPSRLPERQDMAPS